MVERATNANDKTRDSVRTSKWESWRWPGYRCRQVENFNFNKFEKGRRRTKWPNHRSTDFDPTFSCHKSRHLPFSGASGTNRDRNSIHEQCVVENNSINKLSSSSSTSVWELVHVCSCARSLSGCELLREERKVHANGVQYPVYYWADQ